MNSEITAKRVGIDTACSFDGRIINEGEWGVRIFNDTWVDIMATDYLTAALSTRVDCDAYGPIGRWPWTCLFLPPTSQSSRTAAAKSAVTERHKSLVGEQQYDTRRIFEAELYDIDRRVEADTCAVCTEPSAGEAILYFPNGNWLHAGCVDSLLNPLETVWDDEGQEVVDDLIDEIF